MQAKKKDKVLIIKTDRTSDDWEKYCDFSQVA